MGVGSRIIQKFFVAKDDRKFAYDQYTVDKELPYTHGRISLPDDGWPYYIECEHYESPKLSRGDSLVDQFHNVMALYELEHIDILLEIKECCKDKTTFLDKFMISSINLVINDIASYGNKMKLSIFDHPITKDDLCSIAILIALKDDLGFGSDVPLKILKFMIDDKMNFADSFEKAIPIESSVDEISILVDEIIASFPKKIEEYKKGKTGIASMFIGEVMKKKKGLDPRKIKEIIDEKLNALV